MIELSALDTVLALIPMTVGIIVFTQQLGRYKEITIAGARMVLQLIAIGYLLTMIFEASNAGVGLLVMSFMMFVASWIAIRPVDNKNLAIFGLAFFALLIAGAANLFWMLIFVLKLDPWYQPRIVIPLAGMVFSLGMNTLSIAIERYQNECKNKNSDEHSNEDRQKEKKNNYKAQRAAFNAAMIPHINTLLAVGLVSLPGMMTGQILSGVSPLIAVRYQIMVMSMLIGTSTLAVFTFFIIQGWFGKK